jgi:lipopolysaccharide transport system ATP-binding protein
MTKKEIKSKFDEIVDFAGVERYIDTPVKRYSSGMYVRLAFGVAAHLEPEILIVDEVLAVGDAEFQKKALGKMKDVSGKDGRTVLFVSHNMTSIETLCSTAILMSKGGIEKMGKTSEVINSYLIKTLSNSLKREWSNGESPGSEFVKMKKAEIIPELLNESDIITVNTSLLFCFVFEVLKDDLNLSIAIEIHSLNGEHIFTSAFPIAQNFNKGLFETSCHIPGPYLNIGGYTTHVQIVKDNLELIHRENDVLVFEINDTVRSSGYTGKWPGILRPSLKWEIVKND